jgi:tetratricopeptide (TPR) repeat protein
MALEYLNLAIEKDPDFAPIYDGLATVWAGLAQLGYVAPDVGKQKIYENLDKATELDSDYPRSHYTKGVIGVWVEWDWEKGEREFLKALEINPNDVMSRIYYSHLLYILKRYDEAYFHSQMAAELDPMNPLVLALSAMVDESRRTEQALEKCKKALEINPEHYFALLAYAEATYFKGDYRNSIETDLKTWAGLDDDAREDIMAVFKEKGYVEAIRTMLTYEEEYAKTNYVPHFDMGEYYWKAGNIEKSIEWFLKAYEVHEQMMPYITLSEIGFDDIKDDPRIISIVEKMNLPFEPPD